MESAKHFFLFVFAIFNFAFCPAQTNWILGDTADVSKVTSGGIVLMGGGSDVLTALQWMIARTGGGDFVVIRSTGDDAYNSLIKSLGILNSVETILINSKTSAQVYWVAEHIRNSEGLLIAGGDQSDYVKFWKDTPVEDAINYLLNQKKVPVAGVSAGCSILTKVYYSALNSSVTSPLALSNPYYYGYDVKRDDFIDAPFLANTISDQHYTQRDRKGRHFTFLARMIKDWGLNEVRGIGVDEATAVCIDTVGKAYVFGNSNAYFLTQNCDTPEICIPGVPLTWAKGLKVYKVVATSSGSKYFNISDWETGSGGSWEYWEAYNGILNESSTNSCVTGILGFEKNNYSFTFYPNPVNDKLFLEISGWRKNKNLSGEIFNMEGKQMKSFSFSSNTYSVNLKDFPSGLYFLKIKNEDGMSVRKIIKE